MATPTYSINGISVDGVTANWTRIVKRQNDTGAITHQSFYAHSWDIPLMAMATYLSIQALQGRVLSSVDTTNVNDKANGASYTTAELGMVSCKHEGIMAESVKLEFRIKP